MIWRLLEESSRRGEEDLEELMMISFRKPKEDEGGIERILKSRALERVLGGRMGIKDQSELHLAIGGEQGGGSTHFSSYIPYLLMDVCGLQYQVGK